MATNPRCEGCSFCCDILAIRELNKPPNEPCVNCTGTSCTIHEQPGYPPTCRDFECGYATSKLPSEFRPDYCGIMVTGKDDGLFAEIVHVDPKRPWSPNVILGVALLDAVLKHSKYPNILVVCGDDEQIISRNPVSRQILERKLAALRAEQTHKG